MCSFKLPLLILYNCIGYVNFDVYVRDKLMYILIRDLIMLIRQRKEASSDESR
jgi:hypothetical protein